jgi:hypothetical protein
MAMIQLYAPCFCLLLLAMIQLFTTLPTAHTILHSQNMCLLGCCCIAGGPHCSRYPRGGRG